MRETKKQVIWSSVINKIKDGCTKGKLKANFFVPKYDRYETIMYVPTRFEDDLFNPVGITIISTVLDKGNHQLKLRMKITIIDAINTYPELMDGDKKDFKAVFIADMDEDGVYNINPSSDAAHIKNYEDVQAMVKMVFLLWIAYTMLEEEGRAPERDFKGANVYYVTERQIARMSDSMGLHKGLPKDDKFPLNKLYIMGKDILANEMPSLPGFSMVNALVEYNTEQKNLMCTVFMNTHVEENFVFEKGFIHFEDGEWYEYERVYGPKMDNEETGIQTIEMAKTFILVYFYIMDRMKHISKRMWQDKNKKKNKPEPKNKDKLRSEIDKDVTCLINVSGYRYIRNNEEPAHYNGSKHSHEYERRGYMRRKKDGTYTWVKATTCCKGRGKKATHVYNINEKEE